MLVTIDETGDAGFRLDKASSPIFAVGMVIFRDQDEAAVADAVIRQALVDLRMKPELKFSKCSDEVRDGFFTRARRLDFRVRAVVVDKARIVAPQRADKESFYRYFVGAMIRARAAGSRTPRC
jgi:hypothetical protein